MPRPMMGLSIDDFGTGYSSLSYLHRFPASALKIDRSFVSRLSENDENAELVRTLITLARTLGMKVVAEGVETASQLAQLRALECDHGQGYYFSKPMDAVAAEGYLMDISAAPLECGRARHESIWEESAFLAAADLLASAED